QVRSYIDAQVVKRRQVTELDVPDIAPSTLVIQYDAWLILELVVPALGDLYADELVVLDLSLVGQRSGADHAHVQLQVIEAFTVLRDEADAAVQPAGIGAVVLDERALLDALGGEDFLTEAVGDAKVAVVGKQRQPLGRTLAKVR